MLSLDHIQYSSRNLELGLFLQQRRALFLCTIILPVLIYQTMITLVKVLFYLSLIAVLHRTQVLQETYP